MQGTQENAFSTLLETISGFELQPTSFQMFSGQYTLLVEDHRLLVEI